MENEFNISQYIQEQCEKDPEFKRQWEEYKKREPYILELRKHVRRLDSSLDPIEVAELADEIWYGTDLKNKDLENIDLYSVAKEYIRN